jgi:hypothetical protein
MEINTTLKHLGTSTNSIASGNTGALGMRYSNNNGRGYHDGGASMGNDTTGSGRNLTDSETISLFLLVR